eukprot:TRINITY_DN1978_c0_g1_i1.p1 TRINITY_DN1978_c0_g1~~TRINITY_DN1978_c0_g1_i1.p1  ORF type:complete len:885 (+),score=161.01 TRINITY_DN1978_c0_g1_i1:126-2780(+)
MSEDVSGDTSSHDVELGRMTPSQEAVVTIIPSSNKKSGHKKDKKKKHKKASTTQGSSMTEPTTATTTTTTATPTTTTTATTSFTEDDTPTTSSGESLHNRGNSKRRPKKPSRAREALLTEGEEEEQEEYDGSPIATDTEESDESEDDDDFDMNEDMDGYKPRVATTNTQKGVKVAKKGVMFMLMSLMSMGVVFGDIGTSPLYTYSSVLGAYSTFDNEDVKAVTCMVTYTMIIIVCIKYMIIVMSASRQREGGIITLVSLVPPDRDQERKKAKKLKVKMAEQEVKQAESINTGDGSALKPTRKKHTLYCTKRGVGKKYPRLQPATKTQRWVKRFVVFIGMIGCAFVMGDGVITPVVSVLSGMEGLVVPDPSLHSAVIPFSLLVLGVLFLVQPFGTQKLGMVLGPVMLLYFVTIGAIGVYRIQEMSEVLESWNPKYIYTFFSRGGIDSWSRLGFIVLCVTGTEATYADMGHFGRESVRLAWFAVVFPACLLNYYGQAAVVMGNNDYSDSPFFRAIPTPLYWPVFVLANCAVVIASQSLITAMFSLVYQSGAFDYFPPLKVTHTSKYQGQVYVGAINWAMMFVCFCLILYFKGSAAVASAYGVAVTGTFCCTTMIFMVFANTRWHMPWIIVLPVGLVFLIIDLAFFTGNLIKFTDGGWVPLVLGFLVLLLMLSWKLGSVDLYRYHKRRRDHKSMSILRGWLEEPYINRAPGVGVFIGNDGAKHKIPDSLLAYRRICTNSLPTTIVMVNVHMADVPRRRVIRVEDCGNGVFEMRVICGYLSKKLHAPELLKKLEEANRDVFEEHHFDPQVTTYFFQKYVLAEKYKWRVWTSFRLVIYNFWARLVSSPAGKSLHLPLEGLVELTSTCEVEQRKPPPYCFGRCFNQQHSY